MRSLATDAIKHSQVQINGQVPKPSRAVRVGDELTIEKVGQTWTIHVVQLGEKRGSAKDAQRLYVETPESITRREQQAAQSRAEWLSRPQPPGHRPDKRERARLRRLLQKA